MHEHEGGTASGGLTGWPLSEFRKRKLTIEFTGSGSEYFRIWIVNLLLTIITVGLYWPFAKARRIRYFYANTVVDGHALAFHGDPWKMFRGHLLLTVLAVAYSSAGLISPLAGLVAFVAVTVLWPALWRAGLQFRLGNTSWRGLRFGFDGSLGGAYVPFLPSLVLLLAFPAMIFFVVRKHAGDIAAGNGQPPMIVVALMIGLFVAIVAVMPWVLTLVKRYQHNGYRFASQRATTNLRTGSIYLLAFKSLALGIVLTGGLFLVVLLVAGLTGIVGMMSRWLGVALGVVFTGLAYAAYLAVMGGYVTARFQNLLWNATASDELDMHSELRLRPLVELLLRNWIFTALTLGLYRPFAAVHTARLRLEAVSLTMDGEPDRWVAGQAPSHTSAAGEFAGDFFGIDMGL